MYEDEYGAGGDGNALEEIPAVPGSENELPVPVTGEPDEPTKDDEDTLGDVACGR